MTGKDAIKYALQSTHGWSDMYLSDLSDADLLVRPVPAANHIAWQLGHLISAEVHLLTAVLAGREVAPAAGRLRGEAQQGERPASTPPTSSSRRASTSACTAGPGGDDRRLEKLSDADLDRPTTGDMAKFAPTVGALLLLNANHTMMHVGQFTAVRRKLGKPVLF